MDQDLSFEFNDENVKRIKKQYSQDSVQDSDNPISICRALVMSCAIEKAPDKKKELSIELSEFLMKPGGMMTLLLSLVDFDTTSQRQSTHNQRFMAVAKMVVGLPNISVPFQVYSKNILDQIKSLLYNDNALYSNLGCIIIKEMLESPRARNHFMTEIIFKPITDVFIKPKSTFMTPSQAVNCIYNMLTNHIDIHHIVEAFPSLFFITLLSQNSASCLKKKLMDTICFMLNSMKPGPACCLLESTIIDERLLPKYKFEPGPDGIQLVIDYEDQVSNHSEMESLGRDSFDHFFLTIMRKCDNEDLLLEFFFYFREAMWFFQDQPRSQRCAHLLEALVDNANPEIEPEFDIIEIVAKNPNRSMELIIRSLAGYLNTLRYGDNDQKQIVLNSIRSCLDILQVLVITTHRGSFIKQNCGPILKELQEVLKGHSYEPPLDKANEILIELLESMIDKRATDKKKQSEAKDYRSMSEKKYESILTDLNDKLVPVRVHGLVMLRQMFIANDEFIISKTSEIYSKIEASIADPEPYVFLACINLMTEMALRETKYILPKLIDLHSCQNIDLQQRINVGEVLVRLMKQLRETTPYYSQQVVSKLLEGASDHEELIRVSSLINLGELCRNIPNSLWKHILDILSMIENILNTDTLQVKSAAVDLLRTTLSGLDSTKAESVQQDLTRIYRILKQCKSRSLDDTFCLHVQLAMDEIDRLAKQMLALDIKLKPGDKLVKAINILNLN